MLLTILELASSELLNQTGTGKDDDAMQRSSPFYSFTELLSCRHGRIELLLTYWWALCLILFFLFAFAHRLWMCWEIYEDRERLECFRSRSCSLHSAAAAAAELLPTGLPSSRRHSCTDSKARSLEARKNASSYSTQPTQEVAGAGATVAGEGTEETVPTSSFAPAMIFTGRKSSQDVVRPAATSPPHAPPGAESGNAERMRDGSFVSTTLTLAFSGVPLSELSSPAPLVISQLQSTPVSASFRKHRSSRASSELLQSKSSSFNASSPGDGSGSSSSRFSHCCPRYSEDEQRSIDEKRQENVRAWREAKRALDSTESPFSAAASSVGGVTQTGDRKSSTDQGVEDDAVRIGLDRLKE